MTKLRAVQTRVLAALCALIALCASNITLPAEAASHTMTTGSPSTNPFGLLPATNNAYSALRSLAQNGLLPTYTKDKWRTLLPRAVIAAYINQAATNALAKMGSTPSSVSDADLRLIKRLVDEFAPELRSIQNALAATPRRTAASNQLLLSEIQGQARAIDALQSRLAADEAQISQHSSQLTQANTQLGQQGSQIAQQATQIAQQGTQMSRQAAAASERAKLFNIGFAFWNRPGAFAQTLSQSQPTGAPVATATAASAATFGATSAPVALATGSFGRPIDYQAIRMKFYGSISQEFYYSALIDGTQRFSTAQGGLLATTPSYCSIAGSPINCGVQDATGGLLPAAALYSELPVRINNGFIGYQSAGGMFGKLGRVPLDEGDVNLGLAFGGTVGNGIQFGYKGSNNYGYLAFLTQGTRATTLAVANGVAVANATGNTVFGSQLCPTGYPGNTGVASAPAGACLTRGSTGIVGDYQYTFPSRRTSIGLTYDAESNLAYNGFNPWAGLCVTPTKTNPVVKLSNGAKGVIGAGAGGSVWNTTSTQPPGGNGYCDAGSYPLVTPSSVTGPVVRMMGAYQTVQSSITTASAYLVQYFGNRASPNFRFTAEGLVRLGADPFSAAAPMGVATAWKDNWAGYFDVAYTSKGKLDAAGPLLPGAGTKNANVIELSYLDQGLNSLNFDQGLFYTVFYESQQNFGYSLYGMSALRLNLDHWLTNNFRVGLTYQVFGNRGVGIPSSSSACPECYVSGLSARALSLDTYFVF